jgi:hypothetical protein
VSEGREARHIPPDSHIFNASAILIAPCELIQGLRDADLPTDGAFSLAADFPPTQPAMAHTHNLAHSLRLCAK